jgi:Na+-driven multidrug efflux pump
MILHLVNFPLPALFGLVGLACGGFVGAAWALLVNAVLTAAVLWLVLLRSIVKPSTQRPHAVPIP